MKIQFFSAFFFLEKSHMNVVVFLDQLTGIVKSLLKQVRFLLLNLSPFFNVPRQ